MSEPNQQNQQNQPNPANDADKKRIAELEAQINASKPLLESLKVLNIEKASDLKRVIEGSQGSYNPGQYPQNPQYPQYPQNPVNIRSLRRVSINNITPRRVSIHHKISPPLRANINKTLKINPVWNKGSHKLKNKDKKKL